MDLITIGSTNVAWTVEIRNASTGAGLAGLLYNTGSLAAKYSRDGGTWTTITLVTATFGTFTSGGFVATGVRDGLYQIGIPNAAFASGAKYVEVTIYGAASMEPVNLRFMLTSVNLHDATRAGLTALPNANAEAAGGLYTRGTGAGQIAQDANGRVSVNLLAIVGTTLTESATGYLATAFKNLLRLFSGTPGGTVSASPPPTTTVFKTNIATATAQKYVGQPITFESGAANPGVTRFVESVTDSSGSAILTVSSAFATAPVSTDAFVLGPGTKV